MKTNSVLAYPIILLRIAPVLKKNPIAPTSTPEPLRHSSLTWLAVPFAVCAFLLWMNVVRIRHIESVSMLGGGIEKNPVVVPAPPAPEMAPGNKLIVPEQLTESYHWLAQTQRMFNRGEWRVRHIDYENAPDGRAVYAPSPYRWWLGLIAWCDHAISGRPSAQAVERAALVADPILHFLLILGATTLIGWRFGALPAALVSIGFVAFFPFGAGYLPGAPDERGLAQIFALLSVLLLAGGITTIASADEKKTTQRWFILAGVAGGLGLWVSVPVQMPILTGLGAGALFGAWLTRASKPATYAGTSPLPWRTWAAAGAITTFGAYLVEFAPAHLWHWQLSVIHPLYGLAWLGAGEILAQGTQWMQSGKIPRTFRHRAQFVLGVTAIAALPVAVWKIHGSDFLIPDLSSLRLTKLPDSAVARSFGAWISHDGLTPAVFATLLPLALIVPAAWILFHRTTAWVRRVSLAITLGPVLVALGLAWHELIWWNTLDALVLVILVAMTTGLPGVANRGYARLAWISGAVLFSLGILSVAPWHKTRTENELTRSEVVGLIERDLARWLALHAGPAGVVLLAPPNETTALCYYGGMRGLGSFSWENKEGVAAAMLILKDRSLPEAKALIDRRKITHIVLLSWDSEFDDYARSRPGQSADTFRDQLKLSTLPLWLRPLAYPLPTIPGFEKQSVTVFEVVDEQEPATAISRIAEYLIETGDLDNAAAAAQGLRRFPADLGAWVARAEVEFARGDEVEFAKLIRRFESRLAAKNPMLLPWEQRVRLAVVLAKAKQMKLARAQLAICVDTADERKLRSLSGGSLYRLLVLSRGFEVPFDEKLRETALSLLPAEQRERLK